MRCVNRRQCGRTARCSVAFVQCTRSVAAKALEAEWIPMSGTRLEALPRGDRRCWTRLNAPTPRRSLSLSHGRRPRRPMRCWRRRRRRCAERVMVDERMVDGLLDREQRATHGLAWLATYVEAVRQLAAYAERMQAAGGLGETEELLVEHRDRRISRPDSGRHSHEPGRNRASRRSRARRLRRSPRAWPGRCET